MILKIKEESFYLYDMTLQFPLLDTWLLINYKSLKDSTSGKYTEETSPIWIEEDLESFINAT